MKVLEPGKEWRLVKTCSNCGAVLEIEVTDILTTSEEIGSGFGYEYSPPSRQYDFDRSFRLPEPSETKLVCFCVECNFKIPITFEELPPNIKTMEYSEFMKQFRSEWDYKREQNDQ